MLQKECLQFLADQYLCSENRCSEIYRLGDRIQMVPAALFCNKLAYLLSSKQIPSRQLRYGV